MKIRSVMTPCPYKIKSSESIDEALEMMGLRNIRHLPVVEDGDIIGVLTERDIIVSKHVCDTSGYCPLVGDICSKDPLIVDIESPLGEVTKEMASEKAEVALIADESGNFVGIFTTNDACRVITMLFEEGHRVFLSKKKLHLSF